MRPLHSFEKSNVITIQRKKKKKHFEIAAAVINLTPFGFEIQAV